MKLTRLGKRKGGSQFVGLLIVAVGVFHIWAREATSETYRPIHRQVVLPFGQGHTPRASVLQGCVMIGIGLLILLGF